MSLDEVASPRSEGVLRDVQCPSLENNLGFRPALICASGPGPKHRYGQVSGVEGNTNIIDCITTGARSGLRWK